MSSRDDDEDDGGGGGGGGDGTSNYCRLRECENITNDCVAEPKSHLHAWNTNNNNERMNGKTLAAPTIHLPRSTTGT